MKKSIRWLLTESKISNLDTNKINISGNKLICYHLTSRKSWINHNEFANRMDSPPARPSKEILPTDSKANQIVKRITNSADHKYEDWQIEELVITDLMSDPYTDTSGFNPGSGDYHGKGLYTCYKFNPSIARTYGNICLVFEIDISNFLITFEDLAKQIHGENWKIKDQLLKFYLREERTQESIEKYKTILSEIPDDLLQMSESFSAANERTAEISLLLQKKFTKDLITSLYDGIILFGRGDGPVCVSFFPKYDAKLIGLGRLNEESPDIVDWYDSLNDFVGGRAKLKQDFETLNAIAEENTDPQEKEEMKKTDHPPFDMDYLSITFFINKLNSLTDDKIDSEEFFKFYKNIKSKSNIAMNDFFLLSFINSRLPTVKSIVKSGQDYNDIIDETTEFINRKKIDERRNDFFHSVFKSCLDHNVSTSDFFLRNCINKILNEDHFNQWQAYTIRFYENILEYLNNNEISEETKNILNDNIYKISPKIAVSSSSGEKISNLYKTSDESQQNKIIFEVFEYLEKGVYPINWSDVKPENQIVANEIMEKVVNKIKLDQTSNYGYNLIKSLFGFINDINYFSDVVNNYLAECFLRHIDDIKTSYNKGFFINLSTYLKRVLSDSHPVLIKIEETLSEEINAAEADINDFLHKLETGKITKRQLDLNLLQQHTDLFHASYLNSQTSEWFSKFVKLVISSLSGNKIKVLGQRAADYIITLIYCHDIVLTKNEQFIFARKIGKSHYEAKNIFGNYKHIDPDVFIELLGPDMKKGGMGAGLSYKGFEYMSGIYRLLYNHRSIVDFFCNVAKPSLLKMIILNLNDTLMGHPNPPHTWGNSGMLTEPNVAYLFSSNLSFLRYESKQVRISDIVDMNDISWFEYFIERAKLNKGRGVASAVSTIEMNLDSKKSKMKTSTSDQTNDNLDPQLDLSHRKIFGNTLKEFYSF